MRVVHLWKSPTAGGGGGGLSMRRVHEGLRNHGVDSQILCDYPDVDDPTMHRMPRWRYVDGGLRRLFGRLGLNDIHRVSSFSVRYHPKIRDADVIHIHGTHGGFFNYLAIPGLTRTAPVVFTMHDMWALTGHCATNYECSRWETGCGRCPHLDAHPRVARDATALEWRLKRFAYQRSDLTVVAVSTEYHRRAERGLLERFPSRLIMNGLDTQVFRPKDRVAARESLGLTPGLLTVMTAATSLTIHHKGADVLMEALRILPTELRSSVELLTVGSHPEELAKSSPVPSINLGFVAERERLVDAYSAADVVVVPSRVDSFGLVALESIACGTPVVASDVGGLPDIICPGENGYLAAPGDPASLADGIERILADRTLRAEMGRRGRERAVTTFSVEREVGQYLDLYGSMVQAATNPSM